MNRRVGPFYFQCVMLYFLQEEEGRNVYKISNKQEYIISWQAGLEESTSTDF